MIFFQLSLYLEKKISIYLSRYHCLDHQQEGPPPLPLPHPTWSCLRFLPVKRECFPCQSCLPGVMPCRPCLLYVYSRQQEMSYTEQKTCCSCSWFWQPKGRKPDACQMQQKEPNASTCSHRYLPPADVSLVKLLLAVRKIHTAVTLNICSVVVICKSAIPGQAIIWPKSRAASCAHLC